MGKTYTKKDFSLRDYVIYNHAKNYETLATVRKLDDKGATIEVIIADKKSPSMCKDLLEVSYEDIVPYTEERLQYTSREIKAEK